MFNRGWIEGEFNSHRIESECEELIYDEKSMI